MHLGTSKLLNFLLISFLFSIGISKAQNTVPTTTEQKVEVPADAKRKKVPIIPKQLPSRIPTTTEEGRNVDQDPETILKEDSIRTAAEIELEENEAKALLRRRVFGYSLFNSTKFDPTPALNIPTPVNYILGANDQLVIDLYGIYQDRFNCTITPDGYIRIEKGGIGLIYVSGLTIEQARERIIARISKIYSGLRGPNPSATATISLGNIRSIKVNILGEVVAPGTYTMPSLSSLLNAMYVCGGPNEIGSFRKIQLIRGNKVVSNLDLYDILLQGSSRQNFGLQDQDIIKVPPFENRIEITGSVKRPMIFEVEKTDKISNALNYAGGFAPKAYQGKLKVYRNTDKEVRIIDVSKGQFETFEMESGDSLVVDQILERFENRVTIEGSIFRPGEYSLSDNKTLSALIKSADGLKEDAMIGRVSISRVNPDMTLENISVNMAEILNGRATDIELQREDAVYVKSLFDLTEASTVSISGAINNPDAEIGIEFPYNRNMTIEDLLVKCGGLKESAALSRVEVVRRKRNIDPGQINAMIADTYEFTVRPDLSVETQGSRFVLQPFDQIFVRNSPNYEIQQYAQIEGEVLYPGKYGIKRKDERISEIIARAGGLTSQSYIDGATLIRQIDLSEIELESRRRSLNEMQLNLSKTGKSESLEIEDIAASRQDRIGINLAKIMASPGSDEDMVLQDGDILRVPKRLETVRIQGEVLYPITVKYAEGANFEDYVSRAGGFTERSIRKKAFVLYANGSVDRTRSYLFFNLYPKVKPGSEIVIPSKASALTAEQRLQKLQAIVGTITGTLTGLLGIVSIVQLSKLNKSTGETP